MLTISCPGCQKNYRLDPSFAGRKVRCKSCDQTFVATDPAAENEVASPPKEQPIAHQKSKVPSRPAVPKPVEPPQNHREADDDFADFRSDGDRFGGQNFDDDHAPPAPKPTRKKAEVFEDEEEVDDKVASKVKKPKSKSSGTGSALGSTFIALIAGLFGGAVGAAIWAGIAYATHHEIGYVAWGIGGIVGFLVRSTAGQMNATLAGVMAAVFSAGSILVGKFVSGILILNWLMQQGQVPAGLVGPQYMEAVIAIFTGSFGPIDILFFFLAIGTAYKLGSSAE